jgi:hypothetical protein
MATTRQKKNMKWLEIIEIRAAGGQREVVESQLQNLINEFKKEANIKAIKIYCNVILESDLSIHIFHNSPISESGCSAVCNRLVSSLKDYGLVNHTVWFEKLKGRGKNGTNKC